MLAILLLAAAGSGVLPRWLGIAAAALGVTFVVAFAAPSLPVGEIADLGACQGVCVNRLLILWLVAGFSSAVDDVPVLAAVKPGWQVRLPGMLTAAARRRDWP